MNEMTQHYKSINSTPNLSINAINSNQNPRSTFLLSQTDSKIYI